MKDHGVPFGEAMKVWARVAALSFGGPAGQIAVMHRIIVEEKKWIGEQRFLQALNYCTLLPGPEAQQLAIYIGWLMHKTKGGLFAGTLFVLPGLLAIMALSWIYVLLGKVTLVQGLFFGLKAAVLVIVIEAVLRVGKRALKNNTMRGLAAAAFIALFLYDVPFPFVILVAGLIGYFGGRAGMPAFLAGGGHGKVGDRQLADADSLLGEETPAHARPNVRWSLSITALFLALWLVPVAALYVVLGGDNVFTKISIFFSQMAVVTFGGAYAVLAYVAQQAVDNYHWVTAGEMLDGLGMAETTPGPLIMVTQFVGFLAAWREPGAMPPLLAATLGGLLTTWVTFVPCFLWIFFGAPFSIRPSSLSSALVRRPLRTLVKSGTERIFALAAVRGCSRASGFFGYTLGTPERPGTVRWIIGDTESGNGDTRRVHILVKPTRPAIETNLVVNTDRRTYLIELRAHERPYMPSVAWFYPASRGKSLRALPPVPVLPEIAQRRYRYSIEGDKPPWRPINAYDDGRKVYVEFSPGIVQGEMPPLFVVDADGKPELVNSRAYGNVLIVDRLFAAAELRLGGESQQIVRIVRTDGTR